MESTAHRRYKALGVAESAQRERQAVCVEAAAQANAIAVLFILTCEDIVGEPSVMRPIIPLVCGFIFDRFGCSTFLHSTWVRTICVCVCDPLRTRLKQISPITFFAGRSSAGRCCAEPYRPCHRLRAHQELLSSP